MKNTKSLLIAAATAITLQLVGASSGRADEVYPAFVSAISISTNSSNGGLTYHRFGNWDIIRECASSMGITNLQRLSLVYDRTTDALDVVSGTNKTVVCTSAMFSGGTSLSNTNGTATERLTFVYWEGATVANGTMAASEHTYTATNGMTFFNLRGQLQFSVAGSGTNGPTIYLGSLVAGNGLFESRFGEDSDR